MRHDYYLSDEDGFSEFDDQPSFERNIERKKTRGKEDSKKGPKSKKRKIFKNQEDDVEHEWRI